MTALAVVPETTAVTLGVIHADNPAALVRGATAVAEALAGVIDKQKLYSQIQGKRFVRCEGWTTLAAMLGVTPHEVSVTEQDGVFTATVELRRLVDGQSVGRASAECGAPDELDRKGAPLWANRPRYARRSMALTRATAKACRLTFSWVMAMSGYEVTPAEEIPTDGREAPADADGVMLDAATNEQVLLVFSEAAKAGLTKETFPKWYEEVTGRPWKAMAEQEVKPLLDAAAKRIAGRPKANG
jgi:hypothetical protein